jgi:hypothetical protein
MWEFMPKGTERIAIDKPTKSVLIFQFGLSYLFTRAKTPVRSVIDCKKLQAITEKSFWCASYKKAESKD